MTAGIEPWLREILVCPRCHSALIDEPVGAGPGEKSGQPGQSGQLELRCSATAPDQPCGLIYRIDDGIPVLLVDEARTPS